MGAMKGAEAVLSRCTVLGVPCVEKYRVEKKYRVKELDERIRAERTRREARLLARAKEAGVLCPVVYEVGGFFIRMKYLEGKMLHWELQKREITAKEISDAAGILAALHSVNVVHGDYTPANLMLTDGGTSPQGNLAKRSEARDSGTAVPLEGRRNGKPFRRMAVIDFGLGAVSPDDEDKATDVLTMKKALGATGNAFAAAYGKKGGSPSVLKMVSQIESRGRYMERG